MIWPLKSKSQKFLEVFDPAVEVCAERWLYFRKALPFRDEVPLKEIIGSFAVPMIQGLDATFPAMRGAPDAAKFLVVAFGVVKSGTHSQAEVEQALNVTFPER